MGRALFLFAVFLFADRSAFAQLQTGDTTHKEKVRVHVLGPGGKTSIEYQGRPLRTDSVDHAIKVNPLLLFRGDLPIYYEKRLSDAFSVEGAVGVTFTDIVYETIYSGYPFGRDNNMKFRSGFSLKGQVRWYPSTYETAITGFYMAPEASYRIHKWDYLYNTGFVNDVYHDFRKLTEFKLVIGYQSADPYEPVFWDWYAGLGVRLLDEQRSVNDVGTTITTQHNKQVLPVFSGGIKICFGL